MNIAVLGSGKIGGSLARKWVKAGHTIIFGSRDPNKPEFKALIDSLDGKASAAGIAEAIKAGEAVLFAIPGTAMDEMIAAHAAALNGKIVFDAANKIGAPVMNSLATFAEKAPGAQVYRAFNHYGFETFDTYVYENGPASLFFCGPDGEPRKTAEALIAEVGVEPVYIGGADQAGVVDTLLALWFDLFRGQNMGRRVAFKVLR